MAKLVVTSGSPHDSHQIGSGWQQSRQHPHRFVPLPILEAREEPDADRRHRSRTPDVPAELARVGVVHLGGELTLVDV